MNHHPLTIVLTGGGSGGHITPLLPLGRELKAQSPDCRLIYIGLAGEELQNTDQLNQVFDETYTVVSGKFRRYYSQNWLAKLLDIQTLVLNIRDVFRVIRGTFGARRLLKRIDPDLVFSKGGYVVVPVGVAAHWRGIPIITHDSDTVPGLANRLIGRWAKVHATGMPPEYYTYPKSTIEYVGIPLDERIKPVTPAIQKSYKKQLKFPEDSKILMLSGGGNGSLRLNQLMLAITHQLLMSDPKIHIIHITGKTHEAEVSQNYTSALDANLRPRVVVMGFTTDFYAYSAASDLIITRAGATTLAELAIAKKACIVIPSPHLTGGHHLKNAAQLAKSDAVVVVDEQIHPDELQAIVGQLMEDDQRRHQLADNLGKTAKADAAARLAQIIIKTAAQTA